ncbi:MAG: sigma-54 dependent transcriptional regulator [Cellvibrionaceae bacterium]|nr:sigma-54 dependent transcriptional regulator [Cellvibrionaceae bacterium]MCV6624583.1 sigma-54 dependent transcriptional regulator [Cellvibrionaceae bacterium]
MARSVLILESDLNMLTALKPLLTKAQGLEAFYASSLEQATELLASQWVQVFICAQQLPGLSGLEFCRQVQTHYPDILCLLSCSEIPQDLAESVAQGNIYQYLQKPWDRAELYSKLHNATTLFEQQRKNEQLNIELKLKPDNIDEAMLNKRRALQARFNWDSGIVRGHTSPMNAICELLHNIASFDVNVLITGETGTGKELCARALHCNSLRQEAPFVAENCGALPDELLDSELFGHVKGAFTGAVADRRGLLESAAGGTVLLDEIGDTSAAFQAKLLRVLQEREIRPLGCDTPRPIDVRIIAATNRDLQADVTQGKFRQDLYYRLATFTLELPPLRQRRDDIAPLSLAILDEAMASLGKRVNGFKEDVLNQFRHYHWPGNVRELQNEIKRMLVLAQGDYLGLELLSPSLQPGSENYSANPPPCGGTEGSLKHSVEQLESRIIKQTLLRLGGNKSKTAEQLGLSRMGLRNKLERYGLDKGSGLDLGGKLESTAS